MSDTIFIDLPEDFGFRATVYSHGWCELRPFEVDADQWRLTYVFSDRTGRLSTGMLSETDGRLKIDLTDDIDIQSVTHDIRHILRLDDELGGFYASLDGHDHLDWVRRSRAGRLLRSPTVWEDLIKTICTTNCSWALTRNMVTNLVEKLGRRAPDGRRTFPTAEEMASVDPQFYRNEIRAGYRSQYFFEIANAVALGTVDPQTWLTSELPTAELKKEIKQIKGVGDYAAENLLKLLGRYDGLALDSWLRSQFYKKHNSDKKCPDDRIERHYKKYGKWRGLVIWCDMTERWVTLS